MLYSRNNLKYLEICSLDKFKIFELTLIPNINLRSQDLTSFNLWKSLHEISIFKLIF